MLTTTTLTVNVSYELQSPGKMPRVCEVLPTSRTEGDISLTVPGNTSNVLGEKHRAKPIAFRNNAYATRKTA